VKKSAAPFLCGHGVYIKLSRLNAHTIFHQTHPFISSRLVISIAFLKMVHTVRQTCISHSWPATMQISISITHTNPLESTGNYNATSNNMKLVHWPLISGMLHLVQQGWGTGRGPSPLFAVPNVTAHPSTASVPITVLLCNGPLLCGVNVGIKGLNTYIQNACR